MQFFTSLPLVIAISISPALQAADFVNFESPHVHPLDISPDSLRLAACNTADNHLEFFTLDTTGQPTLEKSIAVGLDPVSARFRTNTEVWVANHISDSISIVDLNTGLITTTLSTLDEPCDIIFAGFPQKAYVSCSAVNTILVFDPANLKGLPTQISIEGEDPRALAVSPDGLTVYSAIFESGNGTTILMGGFTGPDNSTAENGGASSFMPSVVGWTTAGPFWKGPYNGQNPPPNSGTGFSPALNPDNPAPPAVGHIVKYDAAQDKWLDDNNGDWTRLVSGDVSPFVGRRSDWELVDNDVAIINTATQNVTYAERMMHLGMALAVNPISGQITLVGTEATNETRFEPNLQGKFIRVRAGSFLPTAPATPSIVDLNSHLDYSTSTIPQAQRDLSIGDPRGIAWNPQGTQAYIVGRGSNNVIIVDPSGIRSDTHPTIEVGEGPTGIVFHATLNRAYVLNQFSASLSVINTQTESQISTTPFHDSTPLSIKDGRRFIYDTHLTSGLGQISCASCHVDTRMDRLAWDLGDPSGSMVSLDRNQAPATMTQNLGGGVDEPVSAFTDYHPMKGPMKTQTLQDIIGKEPFHWRGDRAGIEHFNGDFISLQGDDTMLTPEEMQSLKKYLSTLHFPPNPYRNTDNTLPTNLPLPGFFTGEKFGAKGQPIPNGNAKRGLDSLFRPFARGICGNLVSCATCHSLPSGTGMNAT